MMKIENINDFVPMLQLAENALFEFCKEISNGEVNRIYHFSEKLKVF